MCCSYQVNYRKKQDLQQHTDPPPTVSSFQERSDFTARKERSSIWSANDKTTGSDRISFRGYVPILLVFTIWRPPKWTGGRHFERFAAFSYCK